MQPYNELRLATRSSPLCRVHSVFHLKDLHSTGQNGPILANTESQKGSAGYLAKYTLLHNIWNVTSRSNLSFDSLMKFRRAQNDRWGCRRALWLSALGICGLVSLLCCWLGFFIMENRKQEGSSQLQVKGQAKRGGRLTKAQYLGKVWFIRSVMTRRGQEPE